MTHQAIKAFFDKQFFVFWQKVSRFTTNGFLFVPSSLDRSLGRSRGAQGRDLEHSLSSSGSLLSLELVTGGSDHTPSHRAEMRTSESLQQLGSGALAWVCSLLRCGQWPIQCYLGWMMDGDWEQWEGGSRGLTHSDKVNFMPQGLGLGDLLDKDHL